ncbi:MAG TPA: hypothetical protein VMF69_06335 [Gemmataceae bacterium]|nr:hypothetical protein [Gemmataceae bacterium]
MDERLRICLWMVGGGGFGGVLGGVFGALAAALYARSGGAAGTRLARNMVENFLQAGERQPSPTVHAALIGAADGFFFMGGFGLIAGALLGLTGRPAGELMLPMVIGSVALVGGAITFGSMAYALRYHAAEFLYSCAGGFFGSFIAASLLGSVYGPAGIGPGMIVGLVLCRAVRCYSPKFHPPHVEKTPSQPRSHADPDITGSPSSSANDDFFRKPG